MIYTKYIVYDIESNPLAGGIPKASQQQDIKGSIISPDTVLQTSNSRQPLLVFKTSLPYKYQPTPAQHREKTILPKHTKAATRGLNYKVCLDLCRV